MMDKVDKRDRASQFRARLAEAMAARRMTQAELARQTDQLARLLIARGVGPGDLVGLAVPRGAEMIVAQMHDPASKYVVVACHRGDWRNYPENSIPAIESIIRMGADIMELDLKLTKDSVLVLSHDRTIGWRS